MKKVTLGKDKVFPLLTDGLHIRRSGLCGSNSHLFSLSVPKKGLDLFDLQAASTILFPVYYLSLHLSVIMKLGMDDLAYNVFKPSSGLYLMLR